MPKPIISRQFAFQGKQITLEGHESATGFLLNGDATLLHPNGQLELTGRYVKGIPTGKWTRRYGDGALRSEHTYVNGVLHGAHSHYWDNGVIARQGTYRNGLIDGPLTIYDRNGKVSQWLHYKNGRVMTARCHFKGKPVEYDRIRRRLQLPWPLRAKALCRYRLSDWPVCKTPIEIFEDLLDDMSLRDAVEMMQRLDEILEGLGLGKPDNNVTSCGGRLIATPVQEGGEPGDGRESGASLMSDDDIDAIKNACRAAVNARLGDAHVYPDVSGDPGTSAAIARMDQAVENCSEDHRPSVAATETDVGFFEGCIDSGSGAQASQPRVDTVVDGDGSRKITRDGNGRIVKDEYYDKRDGEGYNYRTVTYEYDTQGRVKEKTVTSGAQQVEITYEYDGSSTDFKSVTIEESIRGNVLAGTKETTIAFQSGKPIDATEDDKKVPITPRNTGNTESDRAFNDSVGSRDPRPRDPRRPWAGGAGQPQDESGLSECEQLQLRWELIKDFCEGVNWSADLCRAMLNESVWCADPNLVYPSPDGELRCAAPKSDKVTWELAWKQQCKMRGWFMHPDGLGGEQCGPPEISSTVPLMDVCNDPQTYCLPDMLLGEQKEILGGRDSAGPGVPRHEGGAAANQGHAQHMSRAEPRLLGSAGGTKEPHHQEGHIQTPAYSRLNALTDDAFDATVGSRGDHVHFVAFVAKTCGPCHKVLSVFDQESLRFKNVTFHAVDVAQNPGLVDAHQIKYTPTILVFHQGAMIGQRRVGAARREVLVRYLEHSVALAKAGNKAST